MSELVFLVEEAPEGGFTARALGEPIFTEADTWIALQQNVREATACHFDESDATPYATMLYPLGEGAYE